MDELWISIALLIIGGTLIHLGLRKYKKRRHLMKTGRCTKGELYEVRNHRATYRFTAESTGRLYEAKDYFSEWETIPKTIYITYLPENPYENMIGTGATSEDLYILIQMILPGILGVAVGIFMLPM